MYQQDQPGQTGQTGQPGNDQTGNNKGNSDEPVEGEVVN